jgi:TolB-like protein
LSCFRQVITEPDWYSNNENGDRKMKTAKQQVISSDVRTTGPEFVLKRGGLPTEPENTQASTTIAGKRGFFTFFSELRRRKVCRAATTYAVVLWLVYQVVELVAPELGLPDWTLRFVILIGLLGFPITLILSWMIEITPNGLVIDGDGHASRQAAVQSAPTRAIDRAIDCSLVLVALVIGAQLAFSAVGTATASQLVNAQRIIVTPFRVTENSYATSWSEGLMIELQHELASKTNMTVIAPRDPYEVEDGVVLTGAVSRTGEQIHVTVTLIDTDTDVVSWSQAFECSSGDSSPTVVKIARRIVAELPMPSTKADST